VDSVVIGEIYEHYKLPRDGRARHYRVVGLAILKSNGTMQVCYEALYDCPILNETGATLFVRPLHEFFESVEREGYSGPRFFPV